MVRKQKLELTLKYMIVLYSQVKLSNDFIIFLIDI